jgi:predicted dehydrogenase
MTGIIGAGFGLYGYFPAVVKTEGKAALLEEAREIFTSRPELQKYKENIHWYDDVDSILSAIDKLIVCVPPKIQEGYFDKIIGSINISNVIFEKPIASTPELSHEIISRLLDTTKTFRIGYTFLYTEWFTNFNKEAVKDTNVEISWKFKAHHYKYNIENWKRNNSDGGGVIRFFGIHLFPLLVSFGFTKVISSKTHGENGNDLQNWEAIFENKDGFKCKVLVDSNSDEEHFIINTENEELINFVSPFETANNSIHTEDNRVVILERLLKSLNNKEENSNKFSLYKASNNLWMRTEKINMFVKI